MKHEVYDYKYENTLKFYCQKVLPLVYDDSLSYYELLCKVVSKLNLLIENNNHLPEIIREEIKKYITPESIQELLSEIFDDLRYNIANGDDGNSPTSTADRVVNEWVWWKDTLYRVVRPMDIGDAYINYGTNPNIVECSVEDMVKYLISLEATARQNADTALGGRIDTETSARQSADTALGGRIDTETSARQSADTALSGRIDAETSARQSADTALSGRIDTVTTNLNAEITNRQNADTALGGRIDTETSARQNADTTLFAKVALCEEWYQSLNNKRVLILGDSLSADNADGTNATWVAPFTTFIQSRGGSVDNRAVSGAGIATMWALAQTLTGVYDIIIIFVGVNDSYLSHAIGDMTVAGSFAKVYKETIDYLRAYSPNATFYCVSVGYYGTNEFKAKYNPAFYSASIKSICDYVGANFIDISQLPNVSLYHNIGQYTDQVHYTSEYSMSILYRYIRDKILTCSNDKFEKHFDYPNNLTAGTNITLISQHCELDVTGYMHIKVAFNASANLSPNAILFTFGGDFRENQHSFIKNGGYASVVTTYDSLKLETAINAGSYEIDMTFTSPYITQISLSNIA